MLADGLVPIVLGTGANLLLEALLQRPFARRLAFVSGEGAIRLPV